MNGVTDDVSKFLGLCSFSLSLDVYCVIIGNRIENAGVKDQARAWVLTDQKLRRRMKRSPTTKKMAPFQVNRWLR